MSKFRDPSTRVKINPETYVKFEGSEMILLRNIQSEDGVEIKYDILLIMYDMINWITIGDLVEPWPENDRIKIMEHLEMLAERFIVITSEEEATVLSESGLANHLGRHIHINVENHHAMLRDVVRLAVYRRAIERAVKPGTIALDLGCGSGILSFFAATAGAAKVFAIERRPDIIALAQALANENNLGDKIEFVEGSSSQLPEAKIQPKADLLISEILGSGIVEENVFEFTVDARRRFLKPGGQLIPFQVDIHFFAYDSGMIANRWQEVKELNDLYGYNFDVLGQVLCGKATTRTDRYSTHVNTSMSDPVLVRAMDLRTLEDPAFIQRFTVEASQDGKITAFCGYFKAHLDDTNTLTNSPWAPSTHWSQLIYTLPAPRKVKKGDKIELEMIYDGTLRIHLLHE